MFEDYALKYKPPFSYDLKLSDMDKTLPKIVLELKEFATGWEMGSAEGQGSQAKSCGERKNNALEGSRVRD